MFHYTVSTQKSVDDAVQSLANELKQRSFGVLWDFDLLGKLQEKGVDFNTPYRILEVCNPHQAGRVLSAELEVGYFLPCKIVVYQDHGVTKMGMPKPTMLLTQASEDQGLRGLAQEVENVLMEAMDAAK
ncbi:DUF302 domain-containing protein [Alicyclobacillus tolerans]|uniref:DUF302 domain-containing protein n=1 Tax=Alicyclobacillus tolerans TaxID=90970 RepID=UPI001F3A49DC|nr:DUF302 domain-containing protein [Alicyclobacillus tolerans]MCF8565349.1 DUF302 domain-containing protein [Alicyclobacillus tolerans]